MKTLLEGLIQILTEAPMSAEDRRDSEALRAIFQKRANRRNAKLTPSEQALLDKYGVQIDGQHVSKEGTYGPDGTYVSYGYVDDLLKMGDRSSRWSRDYSHRLANNSSEVNLADLLRKRPERRYAQQVRSTWTDSDAAGYGNDPVAYDKDKEHTFQAKERTKTTYDSPYQRDLTRMSSAIQDRKQATDKLGSYDSDRKAIDAQYEDDLAKARSRRDFEVKWLDDRNKEALASRAKAGKTIADLKDKYRKN